MEKLAENDLTYFYLRHVVIVVTAVTTISLTPVTNKTDRHDITEILLKVGLNAINLNQPSIANKIFNIGKGPGWLNELGSWIT